jgi:hypothetical protein
VARDSHRAFMQGHQGPAGWRDVTLRCLPSAKLEKAASLMQDVLGGDRQWDRNRRTWSQAPAVFQGLAGHQERENEADVLLCGT